MHREGRYTLYPAGHYPYGREAMAPCSATGAPLVEGEGRKPAWDATLFAAAVDAAEGVRWPSDSPWDDARRRRTQGRRLELGGRLLGVHPEQDVVERERIATRLGVATLALLDAARSWDRSWRSRGAAIVTVLEALPIEVVPLDRLLASGAVAGLWPTPRRWDAARGTWRVPRSTRSGGAERPGGGVPRTRGPPPTTLRAARGGRSPPSCDP